MISKVRGLQKLAFSLGLTALLIVLVIESAAASPTLLSLQGCGNNPITNDIVCVSNRTTVNAQTTGNIDNGKAIFIEAIPLANGGPPCIGCHSIDNVGILGGGTLGPNLTQASIKYGNAGLATYMANFTLPTMSVLFANKPLTANEQADLTAFIISAAGQPQPNKEWLVIGISVVGFLGVVIAAGFIWRNRLDGIRRNMVGRAKARK